MIRQNLKEDIKKIYAQILTGCGNPACQNSKYCATANPSLKGKDKAESL